MAQNNSSRDQYTILILGSVRNEQRDFFSTVNSFSLLRLIDKDGRTILNIPAWPALVALCAFIVLRAIRSRGG